jgi:L-ribulokinase
MLNNTKYVLGVDFGTDSVRTILVNTTNGEELANDIFYYPRWQKGLYCNAAQQQFRQHPLDYIEGLETTIKNCLEKVDTTIAANVIAISVDTTGSTTIAVNKAGTPLALLPNFENNPNAMFVLWKDHTSIKEAAEINEHAAKFIPNYLQYVGGIYSSEWFWAKLLHIIREDESIRNNIASWVEHCDWIPYLLTGQTDITKMKRSVCSAGHKALWAKEFNGLPPNNFFATLDPLLDGFVDKLYTDTFASDQSAGTISVEWATKLGLPNNVQIGVGAFDCHMGAVGGQIEPYYLSKVMGTTTCDMMVVPIADMENTLVKGICGQVNGSIIPSMIGLEAGQSAFGDAYAWLMQILGWSLQFIENDELRSTIQKKLIIALSQKASELPLKETDEFAIDWINGRRTPDANGLVKGAFTGMHLGTDAPRLFKALVEATCFGSKAILERFIEEGIAVKGIIALGGVAKKSNYIMQTMADVLNMPIKVHKSEQTCALGAAMFAATVGGVYNKVEDAMQAMGQGFETTYYPNEKNVALYHKRYSKYKNLGEFLEANQL